MVSLCVVTGTPGSGKTTLVNHVLREAKLGDAAGFITEEVREDGKRKGFDVVTLQGQRAPLARVGPGSPRVGKYAVDLDSFEATGVAVLERAIEANAQPLVVDEVGKMELYSGRFCDAMWRAIREEHSLLVTVPLRSRHPLVQALQEHCRARVWRVSRDTFERVASEVIEKLLQSHGSGA